MTSRATVAVLRTQPDTVLTDYQRLFELAEVGQALDHDAPTILKDNISWHFPFPAANTTPWQLEGSVLALQAAGYDDLVCVQNQTVVTDAFKGEDLNGYVPIFQAYDIPVLFNFRPDDMTWISYKPKADMLVLDRVFDNDIHIPDYFFGKNIVHLPTVKCHIYTTTTGAMKNAFGGLLHNRRHYCHSWIHETLVDLLAIQREIHTGIFAVMDGTTAGNGPGPRTMEPEVKDVILASADQVAIDAVAARMMGFDPMSDLDYVRLAHERGLGVGDVSEIEIVGDGELAEERWGFTVGDNLASMVGDALWFSPLKSMQNFFFRTPLVNVFILGSEVYHDYLRWPLKDRKAFETWKADTSWGQLFQRYQVHGHLGAPVLEE